MTEPAKIRYEIDLTTAKFDVYRIPADKISRDDLKPLAQLMLDAYRGTIDYDDETIEDAISEVTSYFDGIPLLDHSLQIRSDGRPMSAILVSEYEGDAFIGYVMTDPDHKGRGLATEMANRALASLQTAGYEQVVLYITDGNKPSERVFRGLGAVPSDDS
ncbi:MAG TPA: GNAT family N-acetyltransferase [Acidimicrobiia bacterium]